MSAWTSLTVDMRNELDAIAAELYETTDTSRADDLAEALAQTATSCARCDDWHRHDELADDGRGDLVCSDCLPRVMA